MPAGSLRGLHLVVADIAAARAGRAAQRGLMGEIPDRGSIQYAGFKAPDGNTWTWQEMAGRK